MFSRFLSTGLALGLAATSLSPCLAQAKTVPVSDFIRHPAFENVTISPDGKYLAVVSAIKDTNNYQLVIAPTRSVVKQKPKVTAHLGLTDYAQFAGVYWVNDKRLVAATATQHGGFNRPNLTGKLYAINADGSHQTQLMGFGGYYYLGLIDRLHKNSRAILVYATQGKDNKAEAYWLDVYTGNVHHVATSPVADGGLTADHNGDIRIATGVNTLTGWPELYYRDAGSMDWQNEEKLITSKQAAAALDTGGPIMFGPDNKTVYFDDWTNNAAETMGLYSYNLAAGTKKLLYANPTVDLGEVIESFDRQSLVGVRIYPGKPETLALNPKAPRIQLLAALHQALPNVQVEITSWTRNGNEAVVRTWGDTVSPTYYLYTAKPKPNLAFLFHEVPWIQSADLSPMKPISFKSRDGLTIHGYLTLPHGEKPKNLPMVVYVHGGPEDIRTYWGFSPDDFDSVSEQILANHGYAVLSLNYRGSGGYGLKFMAAGFRHWGSTMQNDLADGVKWAVKQGYANPKRICIYGASYGGYAALMNSERFPDLYQCAVGYDGVYDLGLQETRSSDTSRQAAGRLALTTILGHNQKQLRAFSPADNADKLKIPV
ncbi:MAG: alpha/beta hydrolase family protein, partial [Gammaproteobacteria bacterium]